MNKFKTNIKKKHAIKIPENIRIIYCDEKNLLTFVGPLQKKSLKVPVKLFFLPKLNSLVVSNIPTSNAAANHLKKVKKIQGTTAAQIKQMLIETTYILHHKLNLVGVGYRAFDVENLNNQIYLKLGYSHIIYMKIPSNLNTFCVKSTKLFLFGECSYNTLTQTAAQIRKCKPPEPYKGKGVLHDQEKIKLKKGKKI
jgi:large subunit ribosomal protein L6